MWHELKQTAEFYFSYVIWIVVDTKASLVIDQLQLVKLLLKFTCTLQVWIAKTIHISPSKTHYGQYIIDNKRSK